MFILTIVDINSNLVLMVISRFAIFASQIAHWLLSFSYPRHILTLNNFLGLYKPHFLKEHLRLAK